jgi:hypothetical protein
MSELPPDVDLVLHATMIGQGVRSADVFARAWRALDRIGRPAPAPIEALAAAVEAALAPAVVTPAAAERVHEAVTSYQRACPAPQPAAAPAPRSARGERRSHRMRRPRPAEVLPPAEDEGLATEAWWAA